ncbi:MAG: ECF transporter S component [Clostridiales bacterium]|nr:ECF transporter S component [Clostridiales bacterium]
MKSTRTQKLTIMALLSALIMLMTFTGVGYIPIGPLKLTFLVLPVAIGSVLLGPAPGAILGGIFGLSSFITCFGLDAFGVVLLGVNPYFTFITCVVPRILCGLLPGLIYKWLSKRDKTTIIAPAISCVSTAVINTIGFLGFLWLLFANDFVNNPEVIDILGGTVINTFSTLLVLFAGVNAIIESLTALILGTAIIKALKHFLKGLD